MSAKLQNAALDADVKKIRKVLGRYQAEHPEAKIDIYRTNNVSIRIRVIDPSLAKIDTVDRNSLLWEYLDELPDDVVSNISLLLLYTPKEATKSFANMEFEKPAMKNVATIKMRTGFKRIYERREIYDTSDTEGSSLTSGRTSYQTDDGLRVEPKVYGRYDWWIVE
jgi:hypothetical protein